MLSNKKAFTLVEIMIVVAIVALLAGIAIPNLIRSRVNANQAAAQSNLKAIANALENYAATNDQYPVDTSTLLGDQPPYLDENFFVGTHNGYSYSAVLTSYTYAVTAAPVSANHGQYSYTVATGGVLSQN